MQGIDLSFSSPRKNFQLQSQIRVSKPLHENQTIVLRRMSVYAVWDTGAAVSAISRLAADRLGIRARERSMLSTVASVVPTFKDTVLLDLFIDDTVIPVKAAVVDNIPGKNNDFLIGMDVIQCGDLSISTDHSKDRFNVSFKPYPGLFKSISEILPSLKPENIFDQ